MTKVVLLSDGKESMDWPGLSHVYLFDHFRFDRGTGTLTRKSEGMPCQPVAIGSRALEVLGVLVERRGKLASKDDIFREVWGGTVVEESNLTVQIAALRRVLDEGRTGESCIRTVSGRGYRFASQVTVDEPDARLIVPSVTSSKADIATHIAAHPGRLVSFRPLSILAVVIVAAVGIAVLRAGPTSVGSQTAWTARPRLSLVVLPFQNLNGDARDDYLADGITDDLTTDLSHIPQAVVIANASARTYQGRAVDARVIGQELQVRYILEGSVRRLGDALRVNAQLIAADTGTHVWSDRFDVPIADLAHGQDEILARLRVALKVSLVEVEAARGLRTPPAAPDAFDLILRARAIGDRPGETDSSVAKVQLYEEALRLDPSSILALTGLAEHYVGESSFGTGWSSHEKWQRAKEMLDRASVLAPDSEAVLRAEALLLRYQPGACRQAILVARKLLERFPNDSIRAYGTLSYCSLELGHPNEAIEQARTAVQLNPGHPLTFSLYRRMGMAANLAGHYDEAVEWLEHSLTLHPARGSFGSWSYKYLAAANVHLGRTAEAHKAVATSDRVWPFDTVRMHWFENGKPETTRQIKQLQNDLRLAGARDHADEDADFDVPPDTNLRNDLTGYTPTTLTGASVIRTKDLPRFLEERKPFVIDPLAYFNGVSIPGAVGLRDAGMGGSVTDGGQDRLRRAMTILTGGDLKRPVVAISWNSECFDGRNLALRLMALGYQNVVWYRGGREAWEAADLPEEELIPREW